jgi:hypothetical protein
MLDEWIEQLKNGNCISETDLKKLCIMVYYFCGLVALYRLISL